MASQKHLRQKAQDDQYSSQRPKKKPTAPDNEIFDGTSYSCA